MDKAMREQVARALFEFERTPAGGGRKSPAWENQMPEFHEHMMRKADVALAFFSPTLPGESGMRESIELCLNAMQEHVNFALKNLAQTATVGSNNQYISVADTELDHISSEIVRLRRALSQSSKPPPPAKDKP